MIRASANFPEISIAVCSTGQHRDMFEQAQTSVGLSVDFNLDLMKSDQQLSTLHAKAVVGIHEILDTNGFDGVIVQGDTTTAFAGALASFHKRLPVIHVEAGLRTWDMTNPFPEEANRSLIDSIATVCAAPTVKAAENLKKAGVGDSRIHVTGNTAIDALLFTKSLISDSSDSSNPELRKIFSNPDAPIVTITGHRRESFGEDFENICFAIQKLASEHRSYQFVYPVHLNPNVREPAHQILGGIENVHLLPPLNYTDFVQLLSNSYLVLTDSGGIQEEAPSLDLPVLVMRKNTERPEGIDAGCAMLVGVSESSIVDGVEELISDQGLNARMASAKKPYGDGHAAEKILRLL